ncbi:MAG: RluA family pseudouridine synthase [Elusimicrobia bacterium]|nr:RluA family pseudouridine synthase [Elusimicrobiota bacterium]
MIGIGKGRPRKLVCPESLEGVRLDEFLAKELGVSRSLAKRLVEEGLATVDGGVRAADLRLRPGQAVVLSARPEPPPAFGLEGRVLHEDRELLVLDKPAGLLMHPLGTTWLTDPMAARWEPDQNLAGLLQVLRPGIVKARVPRCGIVHRLDRQTSGVLLVAKTPAAYERLTGAFKDRQISKVYRAIVLGVPTDRSTSVDAPVGRPPGRRMVRVTPLGKTSVTRVRVVSSCASAALIEARPLTGRTHQIRAHLTHLGHPVLGDPEAQFPAGFPKPPRLMLHAWRVELVHPSTGRKAAYEAPVPADFTSFWARLRKG